MAIQLYKFKYNTKSILTMITFRVNIAINKVFILVII